MTPMVDYSVAMLHAFADVMACEPMIYLFGAVIFCCVCKGIRALMPW